jgi:uncharacterized protein (TIGR02145 family)
MTMYMLKSFATLVMMLLVLVSCSHNSEETVKIGKQEWMVNDLNVKTYRNGDRIIFCHAYDDWYNANEQKKGACCYQLFDSVYGRDKGLLYNWYAVNDVRILAPKGYRVANRNDWEILISIAGGKSIAGKALKANDGSWRPDMNYSCENTFGFNAKPSVLVSGTSANVGKTGRWWILSDKYTDSDFFEIFVIDYSSDGGGIGGKGLFRSNGFTVRCLKIN